MERNAEIVINSDKKKIVRVQDIRFKGERPVINVFGEIGIKGIIILGQQC